MRVRRDKRKMGNVPVKTASIFSPYFILKTVLRMVGFLAVCCCFPVISGAKPKKNSPGAAGNSRAHVVIMRGEGYSETYDSKYDSGSEDGRLAIGEVDPGGRFRISKGGYVKLILPGGCVLRAYGETRFQLKNNPNRGACPKVKLTEGRVQFSATSSTSGILEVKDVDVRVKGGIVRVDGVENRRICSLKGSVEVNIPISVPTSSEEHESHAGEDDKGDNKKSDHKEGDKPEGSHSEDDEKAVEKTSEKKGPAESTEREALTEPAESTEREEPTEPVERVESTEQAEKKVEGRNNDSVSTGSGDGKKWSLIPPGRCATKKNELEDTNGERWRETDDTTYISIPAIAMDMEPVLPDRRKKGDKGGKEGGSDSIAASAGGSMCLDSSGSGSSAGNVQQGPSGIQKPPPKTILKIRVTIPGR